MEGFLCIIGVDLSCSPPPALRTGMLMRITLIEHNRLWKSETASAAANVVSLFHNPRAFEILPVSLIGTSAHVPTFIGAKCPICRLSSARPMFIGRVRTVRREGFLPRQDFTSIPPKPTSALTKMKGTNMARQTNRFDEVRRYVAGIDLAGHAEHYVCGPRKDDGSHDIEHFGTTTSELQRMVVWMKERNVESAAMESTSVYWIPVYDTLESSGIECILVDTRTVKMVLCRRMT